MKHRFDTLVRWLQETSEKRDFWGGPRWRRILVGILTLPVAVGAAAGSGYLIDKADSAIPLAHERTARSCPAGDDCYSYAPPRRMAKRFKDGRYGTAKGTHMPRWVFRKAKAYIRNHPNAAPKHARPPAGVRARDWDWDWGFLEWTAKSLNTVRCLSVGPSPVTWFGCDGQPPWVKTVRRVKVECGATALGIALTSGSPIYVGLGTGACLFLKMPDGTG